ncbi:MAG: hypothetical protein FWF02_04445 [Micrococcales bacterium]|nr:hypothetical protein [Micrococcales bacterium]MCL2666941.1 hypothetical protein [Micrococcales bacterium]
MPGTVPPAPSRKKLVGGCLLLVLVLVALPALVMFLSRNETKKEAKQAAVECVEGYLGALAAADAKAVLAYVDGPVLATDEVLAASAKAAPITDVRVEHVYGSTDSATVRATFVLGSADVVYVYEVAKWSGPWKVTNGTELVRDLVASDIGLVVNGQAVPGTAFGSDGLSFLVPGTYTVTTSTQYYTVVDGTFALPADKPKVALALSDEGVEVFRTAVRAAVDTCLASTDLVAGCGLDVAAVLEDGTAVDAGSVTRTLTPEAEASLAELVPYVTPFNPMCPYAPSPGPVVTSATGVRDGQAVSGDVGIRSTEMGPGVSPMTLGAPRVQMTDPALPVTWISR